MNVTTTLFQSLPFGWSLLLIGTVVAVTGLILYWIERVQQPVTSKKSKSAPEQERPKTTRLGFVVRMGLSLWLAISYLVAEQHQLVQPLLGLPGTTLLFGISSLLLLGPLVLPAVRDKLTLIPLAVPVLSHLFRLPQEIALWQMSEAGGIPVTLTFKGTNLDVQLATTSLFVGVALYSKFKYARQIGIGWNLFGLLITTITVGNGLWESANGHPPYPAGNVLAYFPLVWLPALLWPVAFGLHIISLIQLMQTKEPKTGRLA